MSRTHTVLTGLLTLSLAVLAGCTSTTFTSTWKSPEATALDPRGHRVAAVFISSDEAGRRVAEDTLAQKLNEHGAQGVASYTVLPGKEVANTDEARQKLKNAGVDGVVTMRVIDEKEKTRVTYGAGYGAGFPPYYSRFSGYWGVGWGAPYAPTEVSTTTLLRIETLVYSLERDTLLWAGTSRTSDPTNVQRLVSEIADAAAKQMVKQGVLAPSTTSN